MDFCVKVFLVLYHISNILNVLLFFNGTEKDLMSVILMKNLKLKDILNCIHDVNYTVTS